MVLTLTVEPAVEREARTFAEERGTTLDALVGDFLEGIARRKASRPAFFDGTDRTRSPGGLSGEFWMADDFDETPAELIDAFENASV